MSKEIKTKKVKVKVLGTEKITYHDKNFKPVIQYIFIVEDDNGERTEIMECNIRSFNELEEKYRKAYTNFNNGHETYLEINFI